MLDFETNGLQFERRTADTRYSDLRRGLSAVTTFTMCSTQWRSCRANTVKSRGSECKRKFCPEDTVSVYFLPGGLNQMQKSLSHQQSNVGTIDSPASRQAEEAK